MKFAVLLGLAALGTPVWAAAPTPLSFGAINGADDFSGRTDIGLCRAGTAASDGVRTCTLARTAFGGLPIARSAMTLNPSGHVRSVTIALDGKDYDAAYRLLQGRYGRPTETAPFPRWRGFGDGAAVTIRRTGSDSSISFDFPANAAAAEPDKGLDAGFVRTILVFVLLGLAAGLLGRRFGRARTARFGAAPPMSMRATLDRKLRDGEELQF